MNNYSKQTTDGPKLADFKALKALAQILKSAWRVTKLKRLRHVQSVTWYAQSGEKKRTGITRKTAAIFYKMKKNAYV